MPFATAGYSIRPHLGDVHGIDRWRRTNRAGSSCAPGAPCHIGVVSQRSLLGIAILLVAMGGLAWLTYASIDPKLDAEAATRARQCRRREHPLSHCRSGSKP